MGIRSLLVASGAGSAPPPPSYSWLPYTSVNGSMVFTANHNSYVQYTGSSDWALGDGDFTIEWWQWMTHNSAGDVRPWSVGSYPTASTGVSMEGTNMLFWFGGTSYTDSGIPNSSLFNSWHHIAICRASGVTRFFLDGVKTASDFAGYYSITDSSTPLTIGNENDLDQPYDGYITDFHWVKGTALYTATFDLPHLPPTPVADSKLLLLATDAGHVLIDSTGNHNADNSSNNLGWGQYGPFSQTALLDMSNPASAPNLNGRWTDLSGFGSNAAFIGNTAVVENIPITGDQVIVFDGTGYLSFLNYNPLQNIANESPSATLNFWINVPSKPAFGHYYFIGGCRNGSADFYFLLKNDNQFGSDLVTEARVTVQNGSTFDINVDFNPYYDGWHFVSFVVQPDRSDLFIDGTLVGSNTNITNVFGGSVSGFAIAQEAATGDNHWNDGQIGYCSVYDRSQSQDQITNEYNATKAYYGY